MRMDTQSLELHQRIKLARKTAKLTQQDVADKLGLNRVSVALWETQDEKRRTRPRYDLLDPLADLFGVRFEWLATGKGPVTEEEEAPETQVLRTYLTQTQTQTLPDDAPLQAVDGPMRRRVRIRRGPASPYQTVSPNEDVNDYSMARQRSDGTWERPTDREMESVRVVLEQITANLEEAMLLCEECSRSPFIKAVGELIEAHLAEIKSYRNS